MALRQGRLRRVLIPGLLTAVMLPVLLGLGTWQLHRRAWKARLLADIARAEASEPVPLQADPAPFTKVVATGTFRAGQTGLYGTEVRTVSGMPLLGADLLAVLDRPGTGTTPILVDLGWAPTDRAPPAPPSGQVSVVGYARPPEHTPFLGASDDPAARRFFALDPGRIGPALGAPGIATGYTLVALGRGPAPGQAAPDPARTLPRPADNHLQYALTWYGFAATLVIIFVLWTRKALHA